MARFLIFDTAATVDSKGNAVDHNIQGTGGYDSAKRSTPVKLFGAPDGDIRNVTFEFVAVQTGTLAAVMGAAYWCMEFFADAPSLTVVPNARQWAGIPDGHPRWGWAREQSSLLVQSLAPTTHQLIRQVNNIRCVRPLAPAGSASNPDVRWFPLTVHGLWCRLAIWDGDTTFDSDVIYTGGWNTAAVRLYVFAVVGGYTQQPAAEASGVPWAG